MDTETSTSTAKTTEENLVIVTIRLIRSFTHRNIRSLVLKDINLNWTTDFLIANIKEKIASNSSLPLPFRRHPYDCLTVFQSLKTLLSLLNCYFFE